MEENKENKVEEPKVDEKVEKLKVKKKNKKFEKTPEVVKVDMSKPVVEETITKVDLTENKTEEVVEQPKTDEQPIVEITDEKPTPPPPPVKPDLPEGIQKVVDFMKDTGGDLNDYIHLNRSYEDYGDDDLLRSYYKDTKPHLNDDEINFLVQESFDWDEKIDDERNIKRKKLALKEQVASAKSHLDGLKSKYYEDIKMGSKLTEEQQNAIQFFNESKERKQAQENAQSMFLQKTNDIFNNEFKGFEYKIGDKRFRYNVSDAEKVKTAQSDINNFIRKFLNEKNEMENASGYHKGLFTAMNSDAIANHFYEQGKADALKESVAKAKNVNMDPRQSHSGSIQSGIRVRALSDTSPDFKFKIKKK